LPHRYAQRQTPTGNQTVQHVAFPRRGAWSVAAVAAARYRSAEVYQPAICSDKPTALRHLVSKPGFSTKKSRPRGPAWRHRKRGRDDA